jgi:putative sporulation protein YtxC
MKGVNRMKLFALTIMKIPDESVQCLYAAVSAAVRGVYKDLAATELLNHQAHSMIQVSGVLPRFQLDKRMDALYLNIAGELADWIVKYEEEKMLQGLIVKDYNYELKEDVHTILSYYRQMIRLECAEDQLDQQKTVQRRKQRIIDEAYAYLQENTDLNIDGFIRFRLDEYLEELHEMAEYAVDEFLMDQQYQEFISLLKYFVYIQEAKIPLAHLIHKGGNEFTLLNDRMEPIDTNDCDATLTIEMIEKDINFEDVIVSTLISVSPQQINIHTRDPEVQIIQTIMQIFENRVKLCQYCGLCQNLDRPAAYDYNKR